MNSTILCCMNLCYYLLLMHAWRIITSNKMQNRVSSQKSVIIDTEFLMENYFKVPRP